MPPAAAAAAAGSPSGSPSKWNEMAEYGPVS
jgi:hypothetical protein